MIGRNGWMMCSMVALGLTVFASGPVAVAQDAAKPERGPRAERGDRGPGGPRGERGARGERTPGAARGDRPAGERGRMVAGPFRAALEVSGLTADQKEQIENLQKDFRTKMQETRTTASATAAEPGPRGRGALGGADMQKLMEETRTQVEAVLNEEQKKEFAEKLAAMRPGRGDRPTTAPRD